MATVNGRQVIHSQTLLVYDNEEAEFSFNTESGPLTLRISFSNPDGSDARRIDATAEGRTLSWRFVNWKEELGIVFLAPVEVGRTASGRPITAAVYHLKAGTMNRMDFQITVGA